MSTAVSWHASSALSSMEADALDAVLARARRLEVGRGEVLFHQGEPGSSLFMLDRGSLEVYRRLEGRVMPLATLGPGALIGEMAVIDPAPRSATARMLEDGACLRLSSQDLEDLLWEEPSTARELLGCLGRLVAERLLRTDEALWMLSGKAPLSQGDRALEIWRLLWTAPS